MNVNESLLMIGFILSILPIVISDLLLAKKLDETDDIKFIAVWGVLFTVVSIIGVFLIFLGVVHEA